MKKITLLIIALLFINLTFSQDYSIEEINIIQNLFGAQKKAVYEDNMDLSGVNADTFWNLYNEYEVERKKIGEKKVALLKSYTTKQGAVTNEQADEILGQAGCLLGRDNGAAGRVRPLFWSGCGAHRGSGTGGRYDLWGSRKCRHRRWFKRTGSGPFQHRHSKGQRGQV